MVNNFIVNLGTPRKIWVETTPMLLGGKLCLVSKKAQKAVKRCQQEGTINSTNIISSLPFEIRLACTIPNDGNLVIFSPKDVQENENKDKGPAKYDWDNVSSQAEAFIRFADYIQSAPMRLTASVKFLLIIKSFVFTPLLTFLGLIGLDPIMVIEGIHFSQKAFETEKIEQLKRDPAVFESVINLRRFCPVEIVPPLFRSIDEKSAKWLQIMLDINTGRS